MADCEWLRYLHSVGLLRGLFRPADEVCAMRARFALSRYSDPARGNESLYSGEGLAHRMSARGCWNANSSGAGIGTQTTHTALQPGIEQVSERITEHIQTVYTTTVRQRPGQIASHGANSMNRRPSLLSMPPHVATSGGRPKPRKLSEASAMMTPPMVTVKVMIMGAMMLGSTWRKMVLAALAPNASAAWRYIFSLTPMTALRAMREPPMPPVMPSTSMVCSRPWADQRHHRDQDEQSREGHPGVDEPLHHHIELAAEEPGRRADQQRYHHVDTGCCQADDERNARPVDDSAQHVASQLVGTQQVFP